MDAKFDATPDRDRSESGAIRLGGCEIGDRDPAAAACSWPSVANARATRTRNDSTQASIGQHWSLLGMTKLILQVPHLQHKDSSGLYYYSHGDCERPSDIPPSSNRLPRGSQLHQVECYQGVSERGSEFGNGCFSWPRDEVSHRVAAF